MAILLAQYDEVNKLNTFKGCQKRNRWIQPGFTCLPANPIII